MAKKIPISQSQKPLTANPFAALDISAELPPGPEESSADSLGGGRGLVPSHAKTSLGRIVLRREKARRGGKTVIVASGFASQFTEADLEAFARKAKQTCGCGGTVGGREIELQGDDPARVRRFFENEGFRVAGI